MESTKNTIKKAVQAIQEFGFGEDACCINRYIEKRMQNNHLSTLMNMKKPNISLAVFGLLQYSQPTTASVERSFLMRQKLLPKNRNFNVKNVKK